MKTLTHTLKTLDWRYIVVLTLVIMMLTQVGALALTVGLPSLSPAESSLLAGVPPRDLPDPGFPLPGGGGAGTCGYSWGG